MSKILVYTFRTYSEITRLEEVFGRIFVFSKLKSDLEKFKQLLAEEKPEFILGIAKSTSQSRIENFAINRFNKTKSIEKTGPASYPLFIPDVDVPISKKPTDSFCNWTIYNIAHYLSGSSPEIKLAFIHLNPRDHDLIRSLALE